MRANNIKLDGKCQMNELDNNMSSLLRKERPEKAQMVSVGPVDKVSLELDIRRGKCLKSVKELEGVVGEGFTFFSDLLIRHSALLVQKPQEVSDSCPS